MEILSVVARKGYGPRPFPNTFLNEKCLWSTDGHYVGLETGTHYAAADHYHCPQLRAIIKPAGIMNMTGMYHLDAAQDADGNSDENRATWKQQFVGCLVTVEEAHLAYGKKVYRCLELNEYFSANELQIISPDNPK